MNINSLKRNCIFASLVAASLLGATAARADTISIDGWWAGHGTASIQYSGPSLDGPLATVNESGGSGGFSVRDLTTGGASFQAWCIDIFHSFSFAGVSTDNLVVGGASGSLLSTAQSNALGLLYTQNAASVASNGSTANDSSAFQLAVWAIVNEDNANNNYSLNYNSGGTTLALGGTGASTAATWLSSLNTALANNVSSGYNVSVWQVYGDGTCSSGCSGPQDVAVFTSAVPEPEAYAMLLAGLGLMGFVARRRKMKLAA